MNEAETRAEYIDPNDPNEYFGFKYYFFIYIILTRRVVGNIQITIR